MTTQTILLIQSPCNERSKQHFQMAQSTILHEMTVSWFENGKELRYYSYAPSQIANAHQAIQKSFGILYLDVCTQIRRSRRCRTFQWPRKGTVAFWWLSSCIGTLCCQASSKCEWPCKVSFPQSTYSSVARHRTSPCGVPGPICQNIQPLRSWLLQWIFWCLSSFGGDEGCH